MIEHPPSSPIDKSTPFVMQLRHSGLGELAGFAISIGAVYATEHAFPLQTERFVKRLAEKIGEWRGTSADMQHLLAHKISDVTLLSLGGLVNMGAQFAFRRHIVQPEDRPHLGHEFGRLITGRVAGTVTAMGALTLAEAYLPGAMKASQHHLSRIMGRGTSSRRFAGLVVSDLVLSLGGVAGNAPAQLLYDRLIVPSPGQTR